MASDACGVYARDVLSIPKATSALLLAVLLSGRPPAHALAPAPVPVPDADLLLTDVAATATPQPEESARPCADDMVEVDGDFCPYVYQRCIYWLDKPLKLRCAEFDRTGPCVMRSHHVHFCIDKFEWPNKFGEKPDIGVTWLEARASCEKLGRRLCLDSEWTVACE